jgi:hypothetical protein
MKVPSLRGLCNAGSVTAVAVLVVFWSLFFLSVNANGLQPTWSSLRVHSYPSLFGDMFAITQSWDLIRAGGDPFHEPVPPWDVPLTYPRSWGWFTFMGIGSSALQVFSAALALGFYATVCFVLARGTAWLGFLVAMASLSPPVLLCIERMNADIIIYLMAVVAVLLVCQKRLLPMAVGFGLASVAGMLKLFPAVGIPGFMPDLRRRSIALCLCALGAFSAYLLFDLGDLLRVNTVALRMTNLSYGAGVTALALSEKSAVIGINVSSEVMTAVFRGAVAIAGLIGLWLGFRGISSPSYLNVPLDGRDAILFRVGAMIYVGTFFFIQSFNYRLIFLLLCLPMLLSVHSRSLHLRLFLRATAGVVLACLFVAGTWYMRGWHELLYGVVAFILGSSLSFWLGVAFGGMNRKLQSVHE